ncbi:MAG TPA: hypothetical protein VHJ78_04310 [Actinomycetota bacterium]|nr:hypothetical protein [Actinomycetota bacterium]
MVLLQLGVQHREGHSGSPPGGRSARRGGPARIEAFLRKWLARLPKAGVGFEALDNGFLRWGEGAADALEAAGVVAGGLALGPSWPLMHTSAV